MESGSRVHGSAVTIRVVIAEDSLIVRTGIQQILGLAPNVEVVASCGDLPELMEAIEREHPDVVLTDIRMPPTQVDEGIKVAGWLREAHPDIGVVVLSQYADPSYALTLLEPGSDRRGYLLKERVHDASQLRGAIEAVAQGGAMIDPKLVDALVVGKARLARSPLAELTPRETTVLAQIAQGASNAAIAESLVLTERSVEKVIHSIFLKLGLTWEPAVHKRVKAVILYLAESP